MGRNGEEGERGNCGWDIKFKNLFFKKKIFYHTFEGVFSIRILIFLFVLPVNSHWAFQISLHYHSLAMAVNKEEAATLEMSPS